MNTIAWTYVLALRTKSVTGSVLSIFIPTRSGPTNGSRPGPSPYVTKCGPPKYRKLELPRETWDQNQRPAVIGYFPQLHIEFLAIALTAIPCESAIHGIRTGLDQVLLDLTTPTNYLEVTLNYGTTAQAGALWKRMNLASDVSYENLEGVNVGMGLALDLEAANWQTSNVAIDGGAW